MPQNGIYSGCQYTVAIAVCSMDTPDKEESGPRSNHPLDSDKIKPSLFLLEIIRVTIACIQNNLIFYGAAPYNSRHYSAYF